MNDINEYIADILNTLFVNNNPYKYELNSANLDIRVPRNMFDIRKLDMDIVHSLSSNSTPYISTIKLGNTSSDENNTNIHIGVTTSKPETTLKSGIHKFYTVVELLYYKYDTDGVEEYGGVPSTIHDVDISELRHNSVTTPIILRRHIKMDWVDDVMDITETITEIYYNDGFNISVSVSKRTFVEQVINDNFVSGDLL